MPRVQFSAKIQKEYLDALKAVCRAQRWTEGFLLEQALYPHLEGYLPAEALPGRRYPPGEDQEE